MKTLHLAAASAVLIAAFAAAPSQAATFFWGDVFDPSGDVMYLAIEETNAYAAPLFSPPPGTGTPTAVGNSIRFDPQGFQAQANGSTETTTSTVEMVLMAQPGKTVQNLFVQEQGDYTLSGLPGGMASVDVGATFTWTILEVDGAPVTLPTQVDALQVTTGSGPNGGMLSRPGDDGTALPWSGSVLLDFDAYLDANNFLGSATKVSVAFQNDLIATADAVSNAFIKKKEIGGFAIAANVPEPGSILLAVAGLLGFGGRRVA